MLWDFWVPGQRVQKEFWGGLELSVHAGFQRFRIPAGAVGSRHSMGPGVQRSFKFPVFRCSAEFQVPLFHGRLQAA